MLSRLLAFLNSVLAFFKSLAAQIIRLTKRFSLKIKGFVPLFQILTSLFIILHTLGLI